MSEITDIELAIRSGWLTRNIEVLIKIKQAFADGLIDADAYMNIMKILNEDK